MNSFSPLSIFDSSNVGRYVTEQGVAYDGCMHLYNLPDQYIGVKVERYDGKISSTNEEIWTELSEITDDSDLTEDSFKINYTGTYTGACIYVSQNLNNPKLRVTLYSKGSVKISAKNVVFENENGEVDIKNTLDSYLGGKLSFKEYTKDNSNIQTGESLPTILGKIKHWFNRLKGLAFKDKITNVNEIQNGVIDKMKITYTESSDLSKPSTNDTISTVFGKISKAISSLISHVNNKTNPHGVNFNQVKSWADVKPLGNLRGEFKTHNNKDGVCYEYIGEETFGRASIVMFGVSESYPDYDFANVKINGVSYNIVDCKGNEVAYLDEDIVYVLMLSDEGTAYIIGHFGIKNGSITSAMLSTTLMSLINGKQAAITGGASTITSSNLTANRALVSNASGKVAVSDVTSTELGYLDGVTSNVQTQLNGKQEARVCSGDEYDTGKIWLDGSAIYRKDFKIKITNSTVLESGSFEINLSNNSYGIELIASTSTIINYSVTSKDASNILLNGNQDIYSFDFKTGSNKSQVILTGFLEYIKNDTASLTHTFE